MATRGVREFLDSYITGLLQPSEPYSGGGRMARRQRPNIVQSPFDRQVTGAMEAAGALGTGFAGAAPAGLEGLFTLARTGSPLEAAQRVEQIQEALTYQPRTQEGQEAFRAVGEVLSPLSAPSEYVGQTILDITGSPALATFGEVALDPLDKLVPGLKGAAIAAPAAARGIRAYHGSPFSFDRFSKEQIGTGEGAQAYGYGLYFAEREETAKNYRDSLTPRNREYEDYLVAEYNRAVNKQDYTRAEVLERAMLHDTPADFRDMAADADNAPEVRQAAAAFAEEMEGFRGSDGKPVNFGSMYEVRIDANEDELLSYDLPLSQQPEKIQNQVKDVLRKTQPKLSSDEKAEIDDLARQLAEFDPGDGAETDLYGLDALNQISQNLRTTRDNELKRINQEMSDLAKVMNEYETGYRQFSDPKGSEAAAKYDELMDERADLVTNFAKATAEALQEAGIKGIRYADAQTRFKKNGKTMNYVVFDDKLIDIARKYGVALPIAGAMLAGVMTPQEAMAAEAQ